MELNIKNETGKLRSVILGRADSNGSAPCLEQVYDAKSYHSVSEGGYPEEAGLVSEMEYFEKVLVKHGVQVLRPSLIEDYNQVFARDVAFVIDDKMIISNMIQDRCREKEAYEDAFGEISGGGEIVDLPEEAQMEGGDVVLWNDFIFTGAARDVDFKNFKTARTNEYAVEVLRDLFPGKRILNFWLKKDDKDPRRGVLHLDCAFNLVGTDKCVIHKDGFMDQSCLFQILDIFGKENCFFVTEEEAFELCTNVFSIGPDVVVSDRSFVRINEHFREKWGIAVEEVPYREISKMGGLLRCSTMPLFRE